MKRARSSGSSSRLLSNRKSVLEQLGDDDDDAAPVRQPRSQTSVRILPLGSKKRRRQQLHRLMANRNRSSLEMIVGDDDENAESDNQNSGDDSSSSSRSLPVLVPTLSFASSLLSTARLVSPTNSTIGSPRKKLRRLSVSLISRMKDSLDSLAQLDDDGDEHAKKGHVSEEDDSSSRTEENVDAEAKQNQEQQRTPTEHRKSPLEKAEDEPTEKHDDGGDPVTTRKETNPTQNSTTTTAPVAKLPPTRLVGLDNDTSRSSTAQQLDNALLRHYDTLMARGILDPSKIDLGTDWDTAQQALEARYQALLADHPTLHAALATEEVNERRELRRQRKDCNDKEEQERYFRRKEEEAAAESRYRPRVILAKHKKQQPVVAQDLAILFNLPEEECPDSRNNISEPHLLEAAPRKPCLMPRCEPFDILAAAADDDDGVNDKPLGDDESSAAANTAVCLRTLKASMAFVQKYSAR